MHEFGIVKALTATVLTRAEAAGAERVVAVRVRRGGLMSEEAVRQAFQLLAAGTRLEGAALAIETAERSIRCPCGREARPTSDDLMGHLFLCPACGRAQDAGGTQGLELVEILVGDGAGSAPAIARGGPRLSRRRD